jgi:hypothetical protein
MEKGKMYRYKYEEACALIYMGENLSGNGYWHQFRKENEERVWCELKTADLHLIEEV